MFGHICVMFGLYLPTIWIVLTYKFGHICVKFGLYLQTSLDCTYLQVWTVLTYKFGHICVKFGLYLQTSLELVGKYSPNLFVSTAQT
jgi:accessory gene regulator protein AgrB